MDGNRFDAIARTVSTPATRRRALGAMTAGGLLAALGLKGAPAAAQNGGTCVLDFTATVRQGASVGQPTGRLRGELSFGLSSSGNVENATLDLGNGTVLPVVGQATGHSLQLRIGNGTNQTIVGVGVGENEISACQGAIDGMQTGPVAGDLGDWHAVVLRSTGTLGAAGSGSSSGASGSSGSQGSQSGTTGTTRATGASGSAQATRTPVTAGTNTDAAAARQCGAGQTNCNGTCTDLTRDSQNCGACGAVCQSGLTFVECRGGVCADSPCPDGQNFCGAAAGCRDLLTDPSHCGACDNACGDAFCVTGICEVVPPAAGTNCAAQGRTDCGGACIDTARDSSNCGACGTVCAATEECVSGLCTGQTAPPPPDCVAQGLTPCGTNGEICVDVLTDPTRCGNCVTACAAGEQCVGGVCTAPGAPAAAVAGGCAAGQTRCVEICTSLQTDFGNCGGCGIACAAGEECVDGVCVAPPAPVTCPAGQIECQPGSCIDPQTDVTNCGSCAIVCANQCIAGVCS